MWELLLVFALIIIVMVISYSFTKRRFLPSLLLGLVAGMVTLIVLQPAGRISLPTATEISSKLALGLMGALSLGIAAYLALSYPTQDQVIIQNMSSVQGQASSQNGAA